MLDRPTPVDELRQSWLLRREAGEGWHENGLDEKVLGAVVIRETLMDAMAGSIPTGRPGVTPVDEYLEQAAFVEVLKKDSEIGRPPQLPIDEE